MGVSNLRGRRGWLSTLWLIGCGPKDCSPLCANSLVEVLFALCVQERLKSPFKSLLVRKSPKKFLRQACRRKAYFES
jgi:hypothetical protein